MKDDKYYMDILKVCLAVSEKYELLHDISPKISNTQSIEECIACITDLFCRYGLQEDDEPNSCGFILEHLIDYLNHLRYDIENA
jgi:hypothetical protein